MKIKWLLILFSPMCLTAQINLDSLLQGCYSFSGNAADSSGNNNHGIPNGAGLTSDRFGNPNSAYYFDMIDDYISIPDFSNLNPNDELSISLWAQTVGGGKCLFLLYPDSSNQCVGCAQYQGNKIFWDYGERTMGGSMLIPETTSLNWHHYVFIYSLSGQFKEVYRDGISMGSQITTLVLGDKTRDLYLGAYLDAAGGNIRWKGKIDDVRIYSRVLHTDEIDQLYQTDGTGCTQAISVPTGSGLEKTADLIFTVHPNPVDREVTIRHYSTRPVNFQIVNSQGQVMHTEVFYDQTSRVTTEGFPNGVYLLILRTDGQTRQSRIIVSH